MKGKKTGGKQQEFKKPVMIGIIVEDFIKASFQARAKQKGWNLSEFIRDILHHNFNVYIAEKQKKKRS